MPDLVEQMYCSQQIHIPPTFPFILKQYAKAAIRTQPYDLLQWSAAYFRAMAQGEEPPVKKRLEYPPVDTPSGLSPGYLKVLLKQFGDVETVPLESLRERWHGICLNQNALEEMIKLGGFTENVEWLKFIAVAAGHLTNTLTQTMYLICELLTEEPEGGNEMIPFETFTTLYTFLAKLNCGLDAGIIIEDEEEKKEGEEKEEKEEEGEKEENEEEGEKEEKVEDGEEEEKVEDGEKDGSDNESDAGDDKPVATLGGVHVPGIGGVISDSQIQSVLKYLEYWVERQNGMVMPRNIHHFLCPSLDLPPPCEDM